MKRNILFVDDDPNILQGLRRMLRPMRDKWDTHFAASGQEALAIMACEQIDAVVSDMRMPGMDGPEFLHRVMREYPDAIRFALSGYSDQEMVGRSIAPTHQYITKPCDEQMLVEALEQAMAARDLVPNKALLDKLTRIEHLPVMPSVYNRITAELAKGDPSPKDIGDIVAKDIGLSANILKLVNSAYFGMARHIDTPQQATIVLGVSVIRSLILSMHVFQSFEPAGKPNFSLPLLWGHCMRTATIAKTVAQAECLPRVQADHAYIAALLHDVGKLLLDAHCPEEYGSVYEKVRLENRRVAEVETELMGLTHAEVGAYLLGLWGLPGQVVHAVARHHAAAPEPGPLGTAEIVYFANLLDHDVVIFNQHYARPTPAPSRLAAAGGAKKYEEWKDRVLALELMAQSQ